IWLAARRLNKGRFVWTNGHEAVAVALNPEQLRALVTGLPWQTGPHGPAHRLRHPEPGTAACVGCATDRAGHRERTGGRREG
ncbi:transposase, partial [Paraburkholderia sp. UCT31]|nr:transposase [Paraburkholderia sp. UCT31]